MYNRSEENERDTTGNGGFSGSGFGDKGSGFGDKGSDFGDKGSGFGDSGSSFGGSGSGFGDGDGGSSNNRMVTGIFPDRESTEKAYNTLHERGYTNDEINVLMSDDTRKKDYSGDNENTELGNKAAEGAGKGSAIGGTIGAIVGVVAAIGTSLVIPGLGILIAGPIAAGLAGAGAGGIAGGMIGALVGMGIPEDRAKMYESGIKDGGVVLGVKPHNQEDAEFFETNWNHGKAEEVYI